MRKNLLTAAIAASFLLSSCGGTKEVYNWVDYDDVSYSYLKDADKESMQDLLSCYRDIIRGKRDSESGKVPPGIYAEYGYLLFQQGQAEKARKMMEMEIKLYPESAIFLDRMLERMDKETPKKERRKRRR